MPSRFFPLSLSNKLACSSNSFRVNSLYHLAYMAKMLRSIFQRRRYFSPLLLDFHGFICHPPLFFFSRRENALKDITTFGKSFSESFLNFVLTLNPTLKWDPSDITPTWELWNGITEMLFNVTEAGAPDIRLVRTSSALLERCE